MRFFVYMSYLFHEIYFFFLLEVIYAVNMQPVLVMDGAWVDYNHMVEICLWTVELFVA